MLKILVRFVIFVFVIGLSLYIGVQWKLTQDLDYLVAKSGYGARFSYGNSSISPTGEISINDIQISIPSEEIKITVNQVKYAAGSILDMAFIRSQLKKNEFPKALSLKVKEAIIPLTPRLIELLTEGEVRTTWDAVNASACGKVKKIGLQEYVEMGYDYFVFSTDMKFKQDYYSGNLKGYGWIDVEETSHTEFQLNLAGFYEYLINADNKSPSPHLEFLDLKIRDQGYNRHRNEFCGLKAESSSEDYIDEHIKTVAQKLNSVDIKMTLSGENAYRQLLQPNSQIHIQMKPQVSFTFADFGYYDEAEIRELLGLTLEVDQQLYTNIFNNWGLDRFNNIEIREVTTKSEQVKNRYFENVIVRRNYYEEDKKDIEKFINAEIKIVKLDGKSLKGVLQRNEKNQLIIIRSTQGGSVATVIKSEDLKEFYVYR
ncbi:MAG: hypothetical protein ACPGJI_00570 [Kangiellaceae bacterium]